MGGGVAVEENTNYH